MKIKITATATVEVDEDAYWADYQKSPVECLSKNDGEHAFEKLIAAAGDVHAATDFKVTVEEV